MSIIIKDLKKFAELLKENVKNKSILIVSHINPDPDTLGSQIALSYILKNLSNNSLIHLYNRDIKEDQSLFYFLQNFKKIKNYIPRNFYDIAIAIEPSNFERLGLRNVKFNKLFIIDHHSSFDKESFKQFDSYIYFDPTKDACSSVIYKLAKIYNIKPNLEFKKSILIGILADTLFLRYAKDKESLKIIYDIFDENIKFREIYKILFSFEIKDKGLIEKIFSQMKFYKNKKTAIIDLSNFKINKRKKGIFYEFLRFFKDIDIYIFITKEKNQYEVHLRSDVFDVSKIAKKFKGGGHKNAAAFSFLGDKNKILKEILKQIKWKE